MMRSDGTVVPSPVCDRRRVIIGWRSDHPIIMALMRIMGRGPGKGMPMMIISAGRDSVMRTVYGLDRPGSPPPPGPGSGIGCLSERRAAVC
eukprot:763209-Hanusia_phi.AAC.1